MADNKQDVVFGENEHLGATDSRIHYDIEEQPRPRVENRNSMSSISIHSLSLNRGAVEPNVALPVEYKTVAFSITHGQEREAEDATAAKTVENEIANLEWHTLPVDNVLITLSSSADQGLSTEQVQQRLLEDGRNIMTPPASRWFRKTLLYLFGGFGGVLFIGAIVVFLAWKPLGGQPPPLANLALAIVLVVVWVIQALFNFHQEWSSSRVMASIKDMLPDDCIVLRSGVQTEIPAKALVAGDILYTRMGDKLPADVRFIQASPDAKFDRSILTGETVPLRAVIESLEKNYLETPSIGMAGTHCISGSTVGVVVSTGDRSIFGRIAKLTNAPNSGFSLLEKEIYWVVGTIVSAMLVMVTVVCIIWATWLRHKHPDWISVPTLIVDCVSVAVAFLPDGLPVAVTASLTIVANIMRKNKVLCKSLKTVETLGSVSVICSDKTGTLTKNQMTVSDCLVASEPLTANAAIGAFHLPNDGSRPSPDSTSAGLIELAEIGGICNAGEFDASTMNLPPEQRKVHGDATDQAILRFSDAIVTVEHTRTKWQRVFGVSFNSRNKFMIQVTSLPTPHETEKTKAGVLMTKGAPDILLSRCWFYMNTDGSSLLLTEDHRTFIQNTKDKWSAQGKRVILLARKKLSMEIMSAASIASNNFEDVVMDEARRGLELVGLIAIVDPPKDEIPGVISTLHGAGIKTHMVTGDFKLTAIAIACECGIITVPPNAIEDASALSVLQISNDTHTGHRALAINGSELKGLDQTQWDKICRYEEIVFARTTPEQKLRIVKELQARGEIVGMTGDGVNDAPSLKAADIGIAMGSGSDVAIEAADMVLLESFGAIVEALKYGRVVFDNLKKTICYLLPAGSFSELWPVVTNVAFGLPQVLSSFLMVIICCFTDCAAAIAIAYEQPEADVLRQPPRNHKKDRLVNWKLILQAYGVTGIIETVTSFSMAYWYSGRHGVTFGKLWFRFGAPLANVDSATETNILNTASSCYFVNLVVMQWFNLMAVRTRRLSILQHPPLFRKETRNYYLFGAIVFSLLFAVFFLYEPRIQSVLGTRAVPVYQWFLSMGFGMGFLLFEEGRKICLRKWPKGFIAKIAW